VDTSGQGIRRRRRWTIEEKQRIVLETLEAGISVPRVAQRYSLHPNLVFTWRRQYQDGRLKKGAESTGLLPVKVSDERLVDAANVRYVVSRVPLGTMEIQLSKGKLHITGRVDLLTLRAAIECLAQ
jgi:transposase